MRLGQFHYSFSIQNFEIFEKIRENLVKLFEAISAAHCGYEKHIKNNTAPGDSWTIIAGEKSQFEVSDVIVRIEKAIMHDYTHFEGNLVKMVIFVYFTFLSRFRYIRCFSIVHQNWAKYNQFLT